MAEYTTLDSNINIQAGDVCVSVKCRDADILKRLILTYNGFLCHKRADISVEFEIAETMSPEMVMKRAEHPMFHDANGIFHDSGQLLWGEYDLSSKSVHIRAEKYLLTQECSRFFLNQIICKLYYSGFKIRGVNSLPSLIVHSSAVTCDGYSLLFTGPSGIGKTTAAKMYSVKKDVKTINDEGNLVSRPSLTGTPPTVHGIPIIGKLSERRNLAAPLLCVLFLKQSERTRVHIIEKTKAFKRLMYQVVGNIYFGQNDQKVVYTSIADLSKEVVEHVPCYELEFTLNISHLSNALDSLRNSLLKEGEAYGQQNGESARYYMANNR